jgi:threonine dehydratase
MLEETNARTSLARPDLVAAIEDAAERLAPVVASTPLQRSKRLSTAFGADVLLKREDLQEVRSFKIRGA